jgi:hypothetical protein
MSEGPLVQPEGVNAGSAEQAAPHDEGDRVASPGEARHGGDPDAARAVEGGDAGGSGDPRMVGTPEPQEESGQDAGSI